LNRVNKEPLDEEEMTAILDEL
jgi:hypothetical protein